MGGGDGGGYCEGFLAVLIDLKWGFFWVASNIC